MAQDEKAVVFRRWVDNFLYTVELVQCDPETLVPEHAW
jgi:hypothetical protein